MKLKRKGGSGGKRLLIRSAMASPDERRGGRCRGTEVTFGDYLKANDDEWKETLRCTSLRDNIRDKLCPDGNRWGGVIKCDPAVLAGVCADIADMTEAMVAEVAAPKGSRADFVSDISKLDGWFPAYTPGICITIRETRDEHMERLRKEYETWYRSAYGHAPRGMKKGGGHGRRG